MVMAIKRMRSLALTIFVGLVAISTATNSYIALMSKVIRPGIPLNITITVVKHELGRSDYIIRAALINKTDYKVLSFAGGIFHKDVPKTIQLNVPKNLTSTAKYHVTIHDLAGLNFKTGADVQFEEKHLSIFVQTDKAVYKAGQTVRFRTFALFPNGSLSLNKMDIKIYDPKDNKVKQMLGVQDSEYGVVSGSMLMYEKPILGLWKIKVTVEGFSYQKTFKVAEYVLPKYKVVLDVPSYALTTDREIAGTVSAKYTYGKSASGKVKIIAKFDQYTAPWKGPLFEQSMDINGDAKFTIPLVKLQEISSSYSTIGDAVVGKHLIVTAVVTEKVNNMTMNDTANVELRKSSLELKFSSSSKTTFIPGLTYTAQIQLVEGDGRPPMGHLKPLYFTVYAKYAHGLTSNWPGVKVVKFLEKDYSVPANGILNIDLEFPENATEIRLKANYETIEKSFSVVPLRDSYIHSQLNLISTNHMVGQNARFRLKTTKPLNGTFYQILSRGNAVKTGYINLQQNLTSFFDLAITADMTPVSKVILYNLDKNTGQMFADSATFNVEGALRNKVSLHFNDTTSQPGDGVSLDVSADPNSMVNVLAIDQSVMLLGTGNDISESEVITELGGYTPAPASNLYFYHPHNDVYGNLICHNKLYPAYRFDESGILVLTDASSYDHAFYNSHSATCTDRLSNCVAYGQSVCADQQYTQWVLENCAKTCSKCNIESYPYKRSHYRQLLQNVPPRVTCDAGTLMATDMPGACTDRISNCVAYGQSACADSLYRQWAQTNCVRTCGFCMGVMTGTGAMTGSGTLTGVGTGTMMSSGGFTLTSGTSSGSCADSLSNCAAYGQSVCSDPQYTQWVLSNCRYTCNKCGMTSPASTSAPLKEVQEFRTEFPETWLWMNKTTGPDGHVQFIAKAPDSITSWVASAFALNKVTGLGISSNTAKLKTFRPFFISLNLPYSVVRGEELVIQANLFNYMSQDVNVLVTLEKNEDFKNIIVTGPSGHVQYDSRTETQTVQVKAGKANSVYFPIVPAEIGKVDISVKAQSSVAADGVKRKLLVEPEGVPKDYNVPIIVDLTKHNSFEKIVNITFPSSVVSGSERVRITAIGDFMGPTITGLDRLLLMPTGCGEQTIASFAPDVFVYNYLKVSGQLEDSIKEKAIGYMERGYQRELTFQHTDGSFSAWGNSDAFGSMWLTSFVVKSFHQAKKHVLIDDSTLLKALDWILHRQRADGSFMEPGHVIHTELKGGSGRGVALSAFVTIALVENKDLDQVMKNRLHTAIDKAGRYLEGQVLRINDTYTLAITTYALSLVNSSTSTTAYQKLESLVVEKNGTKHWKVDQQTSYLYWNPPQQQATPLDIEATSYALLYHANNRGYSAGSPIMKWILQQRNSYGGFASTQDTVLGLQALTEFTQLGYMGGSGSGNNPAGLNMRVNINGDNLTHQFSINKQNSLVLQSIEPKPIPSFVNVSATGSGIGLVEVSVFFHVEQDLKQPKFSVNVTLIEEKINRLTMRTCSRYLLPGESGMAVMELGIPTGFELDSESVVEVSTLKRTETVDRKVIFYFDKISQAETCITLSVQRVDLVAKSQPVPVRVYDYYNPDDQVTAFYESKLLKDSSFFDVCVECNCPHIRR